MRRGRTETRRGFTIVEMLVVCIIIAILAGIGTVAAYNALQKAKVTALQVEVRNLAMALEDYKNDFGEYPPLLEDQAAVEAHLNGRYPYLNTNTEKLPIGGDAAQSLVFWLGPMTPLEDPNFGSFSNDTEKPLTGTQRTAGRFDFDRTRLKQPETKGSVTLYRYCLPKSNVPFLYFPSTAYGTAAPFRGEGANSDGVSPYKTSEGNYAEPFKYQIICAGQDGSFGAAGPYSKWSTDEDSQDNIVSFYSKGTLGQSID